MLGDDTPQQQLCCEILLHRIFHEWKVSLSKFLSQIFAQQRKKKIENSIDITELT